MVGTFGERVVAERREQEKRPVVPGEEGAGRPHALERLRERGELLGQQVEKATIGRLPITDEVALSREVLGQTFSGGTHDAEL